MVIKLMEQPIIAIHEAEMVGTVDGVVIKGNKVTHIYHHNMENYFIIPVDNVIVGPDAVMIQEVSAMTLASQSIKPLNSMLDVYNIDGRRIGSLIGVEADKNHIIRYIHTEDYKIDISKTINYDSVVVVDVEESELVQNHTEYCAKGGYEVEIEKLKERVESSIDCNVVIPLKTVSAGESDNKKSEPEAPVQNVKEPEGALPEQAAVVEDTKCGTEDDKICDETNACAEEKPEHPEVGAEPQPQNSSENKEVSSGIDEKYSYLCGKELLEGIEINGNYYEKATIIDVNLIRDAIDNNAIVKVIMNAED
ncbi:MAG: hypothetical protein ACM3TR_11270 [Caulobacteraceae bacterium]